MTTDEATVAFRVEDRIAWVSFNRPEKRNCMNPALNREMARVHHEITERIRWIKAF